MSLRTAWVTGGCASHVNNHNHQAETKTLGTYSGSLHFLSYLFFSHFFGGRGESCGGNQTQGLFMPGRYFATEPSAQDLGLLNSLMSGQAAHLERRGIGSWVNWVALLITEIRQRDQLWFGKVVMWAFIVLSGGHDHSGHGVLSYVTLSVRCHLALGEHLEMKLFWKGYLLYVHPIKCLVCFPELLEATKIRLKGVLCPSEWWVIYFWLVTNLCSVKSSPQDFLVVVLLLTAASLRAVMRWLEDSAGI